MGSGMTNIMANFCSFIGRFSKNERGAIAMLYGPMTIVLLLTAGVAIDYSRGYLVKQEISRALDASVLAAGSMANASEAEMKAMADRYFMSNLSEETKTKYNPQLHFTYDDATSEISVSSTADVPTILMKLGGHDKMNVGADSVVSRALSKIEVAFVLDNSGSMSGSKMDSLKDAAKLLVDTLYEPENSENFVSFGLVPFTGAVNVGSDNIDASWIDGAGESSAAQEDFGSDFKYWELTANNNANDSVENEYRGMTAKEALEKFDLDWNGCVRARVGTTTSELGDSVDYDLWDVPASGSDVNSKFAMLVRPLYHSWAEVYKLKNNGKFKIIAPSNLSYSGIYKKPPTKNSDVRYRLKYNMTATCPEATIRSLSNNKGDIKAGINAMVASGWTNITAGLMWGWRVVSPGAPYTQGAAYGEAGVRKVLVVLTDGKNTVGGYESDIRKGYNSAYGVSVHGHLGTGASTSVLNDKLETACSNAKKRGLLIYTITFQLNDTSTKNLMKNCATREDMYFNSPNNSALEDAFKQIASGLQKLQLKR